MMKRKYTRRMTLIRSKNRILKSRIGKRKMRSIEYNPFVNGDVGEKMDTLRDLAKTMRKMTARMTIVWIYAEWCGHCRSFLPTWKTLVREIEDVEFIIIDGDSPKSDIENAASLGFPSITGYPTIWLVKKDVEGVVQYRGSRDVGHMRRLLQNK